MNFLLLLVFVFDLPLLRLEVEDGPTLGVVQRRGPVERPQQERREHNPCHRLQAQPPTNRTETHKEEDGVVQFLTICHAFRFQKNIALHFAPFFGARATINLRQFLWLQDAFSCILF